MVTISKKLEIRWKDNAASANDFVKANKEVINDTSYPRRLGSSVNAVKAITIQGGMLKAIMPSILGLDPSSQTPFDWEKAVQQYWHGLSVDVYVGGLPIEVGFNFDFYDTSKVANVERLRKESKLALETEQELGQYVINNVDPSSWYLYGTPINAADFLLWRYCINYRDVANKPDSNKGSKVRFYIHDELEFINKRKAGFASLKKAQALYFNMLSDKKLKYDILWVDKQSISGMDEDDVDMYLDTFSRNRPDKFIEVATDTNLTLKARIERYIAAGVLKRYTHSGIIVDGTDSSVVIGNNLDEAVTYFVTESPVNKENLNRFEVLYKSFRANTNKK